MINTLSCLHKWVCDEIFPEAVYGYDAEHLHEEKLMQMDPSRPIEVPLDKMSIIDIDDLALEDARDCFSEHFQGNGFTEDEDDEITFLPDYTERMQRQNAGDLFYELWGDDGEPKSCSIHRPASKFVL